jgi:hypothetical protein
VIRRPVLVVAAATIALSVLAPAAQAETWSHRDAVGDVVTLGGDDGEDEETAAPDDRVTDVRRITASHRWAALRVRLQVRDVTDGNQVAQVKVMGPRNRHAILVLTRVAGRDRVQARAFDEESDRRCDGAEAAVRPRRDVVTLILPTACLGSPDWVRVSSLYGTFRGRPGTTGAINVDDALSDDADDLFGPSRSPKIHVG